MCGIVALLSKQDRISKSSLEQGVRSLHHRGPDGQKTWISSNGQVGLGHTRLSIIDLAGGAQPISNQDKSLHIIANGEFYEFEKIQDDLKCLGYPLQTKSDSEIALHLYDEFGTNCLHKLRGEFAFIIWDERNKLLFAARDRFGIKPLYYSFYKNTLYLASEIKALFAAGVPREWDTESFWATNTGILYPNRTLFAKVYQVPPGCYMLASDTDTQIYKYWDFNYLQTNNSSQQKSSQDYTEELRHILNESVKIRLRADVPVGCYLSGGIDSAAILGLASNHLSEPIQTFTLAFEQDAYNEKNIALETASYVGAKSQIIPVSQFDLAQNFADAVFQSETLCFNSHGVAKYILSKATQDAGYKVVLTGEGSDEIFGGYVHFRQDMLAHNQEGQDEQSIQELLKELKKSNEISSGMLLAEDEMTELFKSTKNTLGYVPAWTKAPAIGHFKTLNLYAADWVDQFTGKDIYRIFLNQIDVQGQLTGREPVHQSLYLWAKTALPNYFLRLLGDGPEMGHSIEGRVPFLDHKVVELVKNIPVSLKIKGMTEKHILREAVKPLVTEQVYKRQKHPFVAPPASSNTNKIFYQFTQDTLRGTTMASLPFYNQSAVIKLLDQLPYMDSNQRIRIDSILMKILSTCILKERLKVS